MSSFVIALDIGGSHISAALIDIETSTIVNDLFYSRLYPSLTQTNPRFIIASWIECLKDLLENFLSNREENDRILGIACGIPGPMDYQRAISLIQSSKFHKFDRCFGLNVRHAFRYALRELSFRWQNLPSIEYFPLTNDRHGILPATHVAADSNQFCGLIEEENSRRTSTFVSTTKKISTSFHIDDLEEIPLTFENDATCFALGESMSETNKNYRRILALTLGTGFGSTFIDEKQIIRSRSDVPPDGMLWNVPFDSNSIADQWFSTRGLNRIYEILSTNSSIDENSAELFQNFSSKSFIDGSQLAQRASNGDEIATKTFLIFARLLAKFLIPFLNEFGAELLVIGGGLTNAWFLFEFELKSKLEEKCSNVDVYLSLSQEKSICLGATNLHFQQIKSFRRDFIRKTSQNLLPVTKRLDTSIYDLYPSHSIPYGSIGVGHRNLQQKISRFIDEQQIVLIDGFVGTDFDEFADELMKIYLENHRNDSVIKRLNIYDSRAFLRDDTDEKRRTYLKSSKSIFGRLATDLNFRSDFLDEEKLKYFRENLSRPCVVIGPGASFLGRYYPLVYIDLAKNELYYRIAAKSTSSFFKPSTTDELEYPPTDDDYPLSSMMFEQKCLYFLDYPIFNRLKVELIRRIDIFVDGQRPRCPTWLNGEIFRRSLDNLSEEIVRVRPWFEAGPWGGQWLKSVCSNLSKNSTNYAWSFELIAPENGILLSDEENHLIEFSWEFFYASQSNRILGNDEHRRFYSNFDEFPIRFDFLDTIDGGNLSIQCHPNRTYIREHFGEKITQDETYYILTTKNNENQSVVYLGFRPDVDAEEFYHDLLKSRCERKEFDVKKYVEILPSKTHDFFLIPNETIHASGENQVVLEISATPYFYTFKLYDWLRAGLDGHLRPLNIEHGIRNLNFDRRGENLRCQPMLISSINDQFEEELLPTHVEHFYEVRRLKFLSNVESIRSTENRFHLCMLVEGDAVEIRYRDRICRYNYIETFLIPASIGEYRIRPIQTKSQRSILLIAYLKWSSSTHFDGLARTSGGINVAD